MIATVALMRHGGSHLIRPIVSKLGFDIVEPGNFGAPLDEAVGPVIVWLRDPRDRMVSTLRWWRGKPRRAVILSQISQDDDNQLFYLLYKEGFLAEMLEWARVWCRWENALQVKFENVRMYGSSSVSDIAVHLGLPIDKRRDEKIFDDVYGKGRTYTGRHSNWRDSFGPVSTRYWNANGGIELLELMRYL